MEQGFATTILEQTVTYSSPRRGESVPPARADSGWSTAWLPQPPPPPGDSAPLTLFTVGGHERGEAGVAMDRPTCCPQDKTFLTSETRQVAWKMTSSSLENFQTGRKQERSVRGGIQLGRAGTTARDGEAGVAPGTALARDAVARSEGRSPPGSTSCLRLIHL